MNGLNEGRFIIRLSADVVLRTNADNKNYCYFRGAVSRGKKTDGDGNLVERDPLWLDFSASGHSAKYIATYGRKGSLVYVGGELDKSQRTVEKDGTKVVYNDVIVRVNKVIVLSSPEREDQAAAPIASEPPAPQVEGSQTEDENEKRVYGTLPF